MKLNRTLVLCLSIVLAASMALGGTLAFLTDTETKVNTFTVGDVDIELKEDFNQGSQLMPGKEIGKSVWIKNVGSNPAWVWYTWAVPANLADMIEVDHYDEYVSNDNPNHKHWEIEAGVFAEPDTTKTYVTIDGVEYVMYAAVHKSILGVGEETPPCMRAVTLKSNVDYNPVTGTYHLIENGVPSEGVPAADLQNLKIIVTAYAFQTEGFEDKTIYDVVENYKGQWGSLESVVGETKDAIPVTEVSTADELMEAVKTSGKIVMTADINLDKQLTIPADVVVSLDMNEKVLGTAADTAWGIVVKGNLTIYGDDESVLDVRSNSGIATSAVGNGVLTIKGGKYQHSGDYMIGCYNGSVTIDNGYFDGDYCCVCNFDTDDYGNEYYGSIVINGGTFSVKPQDDPEYPSAIFYGNVIDNR